MPTTYDRQVDTAEFPAVVHADPPTGSVTPPVDDGPAVPATGRPSSALWQRGALAALLLATGALYLIGLSKSGWANQFYAAAAQAGSKSWKAMLFGSLDASNYITVDKPPASLWVMDLSMRLFGVNSWSLLVPQALEGVAAVALLYAAVRRVAGPNAGLLAGAALATTPVATLMFRFDNPDALLVLLMTAAGYATVRATEKASWRWLALCGALLGFAFLTKMLQGLIVTPAFAAAYLVAAPTGLGRRIKHLLVGGAALVVSAGWFVALVELWPAGSRPYIGGSTGNSFLELVFGYNGFGRLTGSSNNGTPVGNGGGGGGGFGSGQTGLLRIFGTEWASQISWLVPAALVALVALVWLTWRAPRTDMLRAATIVWGGWLVMTWLVLSYASGIIHPYYTVAFAPGIAALVGMGVVALLRARHQDGQRSLIARVGLVALIVVSAGWTIHLFTATSPTWHPVLKWIVGLAAGGAAAAVLVRRAPAAVAGALITVMLLAVPAAYSVQTASTAHTGALPSAGPGATGFGGPGGGRPGGGRFGNRGGNGGPPANLPGGTQNGANLPGGTQNGGTQNGGTNGGFPGRTNGGTAAGPGGTTGTRGGGGGGGGLGGATTVSSALVTALKAGDYTWSAATTGSNEAASLELASGTSVMAVGGFNGTDQSMTLAQFKNLVSEHKIHYYIANGQGFIGSTQANTSVAYAIQQWVSAHFTASTIGGTTVYDLTTG